VHSPLRFLPAFAVLLVTLVPPALADSPLTSVRFAEAYDTIGAVTAATTRGVLDPKLAAVLSDPRLPVAAKAAICNALGWHIDGKHNAGLFRCWLAVKYGIMPDRLDTGTLAADELFVLGYLTALDDYFHPAAALPLLTEARRRLPDSLTVALVASLAESQLDLDENRWDAIWPRTDRILRDPALRQDLHPAAVGAFVDYLLLYRPDAATAATP